MRSQVQILSSLPLFSISSLITTWYRKDETVRCVSPQANEQGFLTPKQGIAFPELEWIRLTTCKIEEVAPRHELVRSILFWSHRLVWPRTPACHAGDMGSNPIGTAI